MIKRIFWNGLQAFLPIVVTLAVVIWIFRNLETFFGRFLKYFIPPEYYFDGLGIVLGIIFIFAMGILVNAWMLRRLYRFADNIVKKIPVIKVIYNAVQELMVFFDKTKQTGAQQAVLVPTALGKVVGFVTREELGEMPKGMGSSTDCLVYIPLSYQIGGLMISAPKDQLEPIEWNVNQAMSFVLTAGMSSAPKQKES